MEKTKNWSLCFKWFSLVFDHFYNFHNIFLYKILNLQQLLSLDNFSYAFIKQDIL